MLRQGGQSITVDELISEVRSLLDETNNASIDDVRDILPALNRAQNAAANILARHYDSPLLVYQEFTSVAGQFEYRIPEDAFEQRVEKVEVKYGQQFFELERVDFRQMSKFDYPSLSAYPMKWCSIQDRIRLLPGVGPQNTYRIWYLAEPAEMVKSQGRINIVNAAQNYVVVDAVGSDITTEVDSLRSYCNIIDGNTGVRKATLQVQSINQNRITFRTVPTRDVVLNTTVDTDLTDLVVNATTQSEELVVEPDDHICLIPGSCIPFFKNPFSNFVIEWATAELMRKLGADTNQQKELVREMQELVENSWAGRETTAQVKKKSNKFTKQPNVLWPFTRQN